MQLVVRIFSVLTVSMLLVPGVHAQAKDQLQSVLISIPQMDCGGCEIAVRVAAKKVSGVRQVKTDSDKRVADVTYDAASTNVKAIVESIEKNSGFKAEESKRR